MSEATATNSEIYEGDEYEAIYGGNVGGQLNKNLIGNAGEASWEDKLKKIKRTVPNLDTISEIYIAEAEVMEVSHHIRAIREALKELKTLLGPEVD